MMQNISLDDFFKIANGLLDELITIHNEGNIHSAINPSHILIQEESSTIQLLHPHKKDFEYDLSMLVYMAPEHSHRLNVVLDHRSDLYSLGVVFYEWLTGCLPFEEKEPEALLHAKLTQQPIPPNITNPTIPKVLSDIILKLLSQKPDERYQSTLGLKQDLLHCNATDFLLGQFDYHPVFKLPEKLYGREEELKQLREILNKIDPSGVEVLIVSGYSGVGKTTVINALESELVSRGGYFAMGKFGQQKQNIAYSGLGELFGHLVKQILSADDASILRWRKKLLSALGGNGQVIIDIVPELKLLIGEQSALTEMSPLEAKNRFDHSFQKFISVFSNPKHPLALFLDDLQWADLASLDALRLILNNNSEKSLLLLGSYRDNEVDSIHPLNILLEEVRQKQINVHDMRLKPLKTKDIEQWVSDAVHYHNDDVVEVSRWVHEKTAGNPFYIKLFLRVLHEDDLIFLNKQNNTWIFNIPAIKALPATKNVGDLMSRRLNGLSQDLQYILQVAACFGNRFDKDLLGHVLGDAEDSLTGKLLLLVSQGLLFKNENSYHFVHDQVQSAALSLLPENNIQMIHIRIGKTLLNILSDQEKDESITKIVEHLNRGKVFLKKKEELATLIQFNLKASAKAKGSMAHQSAFDYLDGSKNIIESEPRYFWGECLELTFDFFYAYADLLFLLRKIELAEYCCNNILNHSNSIFNKSKISLLRIKHYANNGKLNEAIEEGISALNELGIYVPKTPSLLSIYWKVIRVKFLMNNVIHKGDVNNHTSKNSLDEIIINIFMEMIPAAHHSGNYKLATLFAANGSEYCLKNGFTYNSSYLLLIYSGTFRFVFKGLKLDFEYIEFSLKLNDLYDNKLLTGRLNFLFSIMGVWDISFRRAFESLDLAIKQALDSGDFFYYSLSRLFEIFFKINKSNNTYIEIKEYYGNIMEEGFIKFVDLDGELFSFNADFLDYLNKFNRIVSKKRIKNINNTSLMLYHTLKGMSCYHGECYNKSFLQFQKIKNIIKECIGNPFIIFHLFYLFLSSLELFKRSSLLNKPYYLMEMLRIYRDLRSWYKACPENFSYYVYIMEAEFSNIFGQYKVAAKKYDQSIQISKEHEFLLDEALANELAAKFHLGNKSETIASSYMQEARRLYQKWGADAKIDFLEKKYPQLLPQEEAIKIEENRSTSLSDLIDMQSVLKTSQAISSTLELDKLLSKLLKSMLQNAGAEKGYFIQVQENKLHIIASIEKDSTSVNLHSPHLLSEDSSCLAASIVNYVKNTQESIVLGNAVKDNLYQQDIYIKQHQPKSILCLPILKQEKLLGILYLENNRATDIFTQDRVALLKMLSTQAAISLENAFLFEANQKSQQRIQQHQTEIAHYARVNTLSELATGLAHEINQPLASSLNYLGECLERLKANKTCPDIIAGVEKASTGIERAGEIIQHLRSSIKKQDITKKMINLNDVINHVLPLLNYKIKSTETQLILNLSGTLPHVCADTLQMEQVLINLINNALEALLEVDEKKRTLTITTQHSQNHIEINIKDTGKGIDPTIQEKLFQPFMTTKPEGLGMGLTICKTIIETYSGQIKAECHEDGTEFNMVIPTN